MNNLHHLDDDDDEVEGYRKIDQYNTKDVERIAAHYTDILDALGEKPEREGSRKTPE